MTKRKSPIRAMVSISVDTPAAQLEARRRQLGYSIAHVADEAGYSESSVARVLKGHNTNWRTMRDIASVLGLDVLLTDKPAA
jgi:lambda repressor-like predicted transcriptional regulator